MVLFQVIRQVSVCWVIFLMKLLYWQLQMHIRKQQSGMKCIRRCSNNFKNTFSTEQWAVSRSGMPVQPAPNQAHILPGNASSGLSHSVYPVQQGVPSLAG